MIKKSSVIVLRALMLMGFTLAVTAALLIYKNRDLLSRLGHPNGNPMSTEVFSRRLDLKRDGRVTWDRVIEWLRVTQYTPVQQEPDKPGEYRASDPVLTVFVRPFRYPDQDYPAQRLRLKFSDRFLVKIETVSGHAALESWRLEPCRLAEWSSAGRTASMVKVTELPPYVPAAVLAMEDKRFYRHGAFDLLGIARALWIDVRSGHLRQGASTISQQLARSIFLDVSRTLRRKVLEAMLALYLELRYSKVQLLEMYLNQVYWGQDGSQSLIGLEAASRSFFGKPARALTLAESASLAGMLQSPNRYSPRNDLTVAETRKAIVLGLMHDQGVISETQYAAALQEKLQPVPAKSSNESAYFLAALRDRLGEAYTLPAFLNRGWRIFTTLDPLLQHEAVQVVSSLHLPIAQKGRAQAEGPQAALVAVDPATGAVLAWVGGTQFQTNPFDHAADARRQPGSAFKPFVALAALESRKVTLATLLDDKPLRLKGKNGPWQPQNYDRRFRGTVTVWESLVESLNVPFIRLAMMTGIPSILDAARRVGINSPLREDLSLALGTSELSLVELTGAYGTLASGGVRHMPYSLDRIDGSDGVLFEAPPPSSPPAFSPEVVFIVTQGLEAVMDQGTGKTSRAMGYLAPAAGKTGTSENYQDAWFMGYTPNLVCGVWVGYDKPRSLGRAAAGVALPLWTTFMKKASLYEAPSVFQPPSDLVWKTIDPKSGLLVRSGCPDRQKLPFLSGTEPSDDCPLHPGGVIGFFHRLKAHSK